MKLFPYNPSEFSVEFAKRMRKHPDIIQMPSPRQVMTIPQLLLARYLRNGKRLSVKDYIEIGVATSFPNNQELAKKIVFQIMFPNYSIRDIDSFLEENHEKKEDSYDRFIDLNEEYESQQIQQLCDEISCSNDLNVSKVSNIEQFEEGVIQNRFQEPFKSALVFFKEGTSDFYVNEIISVEELLNLTKQKIIEKINSLEPRDLIAIKELGFNDLVENQSRKKWERITSKALNRKEIDADLFKLKSRGSFEDFIKTTKFLKDTNALDAKRFLKLKKNLSDKIKTLEHVFHAAMELNEIPDFDLNRVFLFSIYKIPLARNLSLAKSLDQYFGTDYRNLLFELLDKEFYKSNAFKSQLHKDKTFLESMCTCSIKSSSWLALFEKVLLWEITNAKNAFHPHENYKLLTHEIVQFTHSCENIFCSQKISQFLPHLMKLSVESCIVPSDLKDVVEFLKKIGLSPDEIIVKNVGQKMGMPEVEIAELIEPSYEVLKKYMNKPNASFKKMQELIDKLKVHLDFEKILELMKIALGSDNREALAALGHFNLEYSLEAAQMFAGKQGMEKVISSLSAGDGESLIKQWFLHRDKVPQFLKDKIKTMAKYMLIELGINYSKTYLGSLASGTIQTNLVRPYEIGDSFEDIDLEETMFNLLEKGKLVDHITYDDFYVFISSSGLRSVCIEMDISESMTGEKLAYMAICVTMLVYGMRKDELGIVLFERNTHVLKEIDQNIDLEALADQLLNMRARGTTYVEKALDWAKDQFKRAYKSKYKINIMFTDAEIYDIPNAAEDLRAFKSIEADFILVCPENQFNIKESEQIVKLSGGQLLTVKNWENFPELISKIINSRF